MTETRALRAYAEVALGRQRSPQHESGPNMTRYLRAANVQDGELDLRDVKEMNFEPAEQRLFSLRPGDILVSEGSGSLSSVGASAVWGGELDGPVCFQNTLLRVRARPSTEARFLAWWCRHAFADGLFASVSSGANIFHLSAERVRSLPMTYLPLGQQRETADFLDTETACIDALLGKKRRMIDLLDERSTAAIDRTLDLALDWSRTGVPRPIAGQSPVFRLGFVAVVQTGLTLDAARDVGPDVVSVPYLRVANVQDGSIDLTDVKEVRVPPHMAQRTTLRPGDVLMTEGGDPDKLGRGAVWNGQLSPCLHQNHVFAVRPGDGLRPDYLALLTRSSYARAYFEVTASKTTGIASTSTAKIASLRIPVPDVQTQERIVARWLQVNSGLTAAVKRLAHQVTLLQEHRQALITAAVTGELEIPGAAA